MTTKVLFLSLDGAEPALLRQWAAAGELPIINTLMQSWFAADIDTPPGLGDGAFWATLHTGCNAGKHGHYFPWQFCTDTYTTTTYDFDNDFGRDPFWMYASKMGQRVGIVDLFSAPLIQGLNGVQIADWMIRDRTDTPRSWPDALITAIHEKFGEDPVAGYTGEVLRSVEQWNDLHNRFEQRIKVKTEAIAGMLTSNEWDLFAASFSDLHDICHQSWHWHDPDAKDYPIDWVSLHGDPVLQAYKAVDNAIGKIIDSAGASHIFLVAGLGMESQVTCNPALDKILGAISGHFGSRPTLQTMWSSRPYFALPHNMNSGAIRLNLKGRERSGIIGPDQYHNVCNELETKLKTLVASDSGLPVVDQVVKVREEYKGTYAEQLPDMMVVWKRPQSYRRVRLPGLGEFNVNPANEVEARSGDHTANAMLLCNRKLLDPANTCPQRIVTESIAPTIGRAMGLRLPGMDAAPHKII